MFEGSLRDSWGRIEFEEIKDGDKYIFTQILIASNSKMHIFLGVVGWFDVVKFIWKNGMLIKFSMAVGYGCYLVEIVAGSVAALHGIGVVHVEMSIEDNSSTALFWHILVFVFCVHVIFTETAVEVIELDAVEGKETGK